jgi:xanthine/uracil permease
MKNDQLFSLKNMLHKISFVSVIGLVFGALGGYIYYAQVGCVSGTCAITSNPWMSTAWGAAFGYLVFDLFNRKKNTKE